MREASKRLTENGRSVEGRLFLSPIGKIENLGAKTILTGKTGVVTITKAKTLHGQTLYLRKYERRDQTSGELTNREEGAGRIKRPVKCLVLDVAASRQLRDDPLYAKITFKKVLKIVELLSRGEKSPDEIAKTEKVDPDIVKGLLKLMEQGD